MISKTYEPEKVELYFCEGYVKIGKNNFSKEFFYKHEEKIRYLINMGETMFNETWNNQEIKQFKLLLSNLNL